MNNKKGFLLLEVMVSIVMITGGLLFVTRVYSTSKGIVDRSRVSFNCGLLLEDKIFDFEEKGKIEAASREGDFGEGYKDYFWNLNATAAEGANLNIVNLEVSKGKGSKGDKFSLATYLNKSEMKSGE